MKNIFGAAIRQSRGYANIARKKTLNTGRKVASALTGTITLPKVPGVFTPSSLGNSSTREFYKIDFFAKLSQSLQNAAQKFDEKENTQYPIKLDAPFSSLDETQKTSAESIDEKPQEYQRSKVRTHEIDHKFKRAVLIKHIQNSETLDPKAFETNALKRLLKYGRSSKNNQNQNQNQKKILTALLGKPQFQKQFKTAQNQLESIKKKFTNINTNINTNIYPQPPKKIKKAGYKFYKPLCIKEEAEYKLYKSLGIKEEEFNILCESKKKLTKDAIRQIIETNGNSQDLVTLCNEDEELKKYAIQQIIENNGNSQDKDKKLKKYAIQQIIETNGNSQDLVTLCNEDEELKKYAIRQIIKNNNTSQDLVRLCNGDKELTKYAIRQIIKNKKEDTYSEAIIQLYGGDLKAHLNSRFNLGNKNGNTFLEACFLWKKLFEHEKNQTSDKSKAYGHLIHIFDNTLELERSRRRLNKEKLKQDIYTSTIKCKHPTIIGLLFNKQDSNQKRIGGHTVGALVRYNRNEDTYELNIRNSHLTSKPIIMTFQNLDDLIDFIMLKKNYSDDTQSNDTEKAFNKFDKGDFSVFTLDNKNKTLDKTLDKYIQAKEIEVKVQDSAEKDSNYRQDQGVCAIVAGLYQIIRDIGHNPENWRKIGISSIKDFYALSDIFDNKNSENSKRLMERMPSFHKK